MATTYRFRTVDFRTAPPGWRIAFATALGPIVEPMPGWLIREEVEYDTRTEDSVTCTGSREVVAALVVEGEAAPAYSHPDFWQILGPGEPDPTPEETAEKVARRAPASS
ncbi:hypothetical protein ABZ027_08370 [Streptomyces sp. NPDC006332]|uniref:hypothetical protein n=1 Tax=Streptomyces sp. NPDC006332 TaxID=3155456 RepID=UPI0033A103A9